MRSRVCVCVLSVWCRVPPIFNALYSDFDAVRVTSDGDELKRRWVYAQCPECNHASDARNAIKFKWCAGVTYWYVRMCA